jgi:hypothetical protein
MKKADGFANPLWPAISLVLLAISTFCNPPTLCLRHKGRGDAAVRSVSWIEGRRSR